LISYAILMQSEKDTHLIDELSFVELLSCGLIYGD
jgi:hypothetical protein